ncbi:helicase DnaB [Lactiplantibacillus plantarum]|nr:helicase DnaB [Lactiplantibacillus plantarum]
MVNNMPNDEPKLSPKTGVIVPQVAELNPMEHKVLEKMYLPIIGPIAYGLYAALKSVQVDTTSTHEYHNHAQLLMMLGVDFPNVINARKKLEAVGLLRSFYHDDNDQGMCLYQLERPMTASDFFDDDLLSILLLDTIGEIRYGQLADDFEPVSLDLSSATEITADILDVFHIDSEKVLDTPDNVISIRERVQQDDKANLAKHNLTNEEFDWKFLGQILKNNYVDLKEVSKNRQLILTECKMYGLDELQIAKLISEITSLETGKFDVQELKILISKRYTRATVAMMSTKEKAQLVSETEAAQKKRQKKAREKREKELSGLFEIVNSKSPNEFLEMMKYRMNGNVTTSERYAIKNLVKETTLPSPVINMLIYHMFVDEEVKTLKRALLETIADDWQQAKILTPEMAIDHIRNREKKIKTKKEKQSQRRRQQGGRPVRKEIIPEWAKSKEIQQSKNQLSEEQQKQLDEQLKNMDD